MKINVRLVIEVDLKAYRAQYPSHVAVDSDEDIRNYIASVVVDRIIEAFDYTDAVQVIGEAVS